jgi:hypothetical protein
MKKIISFSLYGVDPKYYVGMYCNAEIAKKIYPDWICRVYYDSSLPSHAVETLKKYDNVELVDMTNYEPKIFPMMWRFLAIDDDDVQIMLSRDSDARLSNREKYCVDIFENSNYLLHSIRDNGSHFDIMGGMWGIKKNDKVKVINLIDKNDCFTYDCDQIFLRQKFVKYFKDSYLIHCSSYLNTFPIKKENEYFVGGWWYADNFGKPYDYIFF